MNRNRLGTLALLVATAVVGCDGPLSLESGVPESELTFVRVADDAPPLAATEASVWVKRGEDRELRINYLAYNGDTLKCLRFRVPAEAPLRHPDGRDFASGDSVLVTVRVIDESRFAFEFSPAGLVFDPAHPAELEVRYTWADPDFNGDGREDVLDERIADRFGFWRNEAAGEPWFRVTTRRFEDVMEARADIVGFTAFALASN